MAEISKGKSPFYPGQPVPVELFVGRAEQIDRIMTRGAAQVAAGKQVAIYVQGEYGIGKSSFARFVQLLAEKEHGLHGIYTSLGSARLLSELPAAVMQGTIDSGILEPSRRERIWKWLGKYITKGDLFGVTLNLSALAPEMPTFTTPPGMLKFFSEVMNRLREAGVRGLFVILDEINGITSDPQFALFLKGLIDTNATAKEPVPLLLMLCGVEERRREMIQNHQPVDRLFDVIEIEAMTQQEMEQFFSKAFHSVQMTVQRKAMDMMTHYSAGFPKIMHLVGDWAYWIDKDGVVDESDATQAVLAAAHDVGAKYVDQQVYRALRSSDYRSILAKIAKMGPATMSFTKEQVARDLTESEKRKFANFLQKMKKLNVIRSGDVRGEYVFNVRMVRLYIWLQSLEARNKSKS